MMVRMMQVPGRVPGVDQSVVNAELRAQIKALREENARLRAEAADMGVEFGRLAAQVAVLEETVFQGE
jgi:uncharacterized protein involved in exopolysaccharide biosynthesis